MNSTLLWSHKIISYGYSFDVALLTYTVNCYRYSDASKFPVPW